MADKQQSLANHTRLDPPFHFFLVPGGLVLLVSAVTLMVQAPSSHHAALLFGVLWGIVAVFKTRLYALKVQDRVIRMEERIRLKECLPAPLAARIEELSVEQLIGLRFASTAELPGLVEKTLASKWDRKQIKQAIQNWRADDWRV